MNKKKDSPQSASVEIEGKKITFKTGELANQANGSVTVQIGDTVVLGTATMSTPPSPDIDYLPLLVDYEEKFYAAGKIKGSRFIKREGRPTDDAILNARLIDRAIRPLFPEGMINDVQIVITILSYDGANDPDTAAMMAAYTALMISDIPWQGPLAAVRVAHQDGNFIINPTVAEKEGSDLDLVVAGTGNNITMIEAGAHELSEEDAMKAFTKAQAALGKIVPVIEKFRKSFGKEKQEPILAAKNTELINLIKDKAKGPLAKYLEQAKTKQGIAQAERDTAASIVEDLAASSDSTEEVSERLIREAVHELHGEYTRERILKDGWRADGRTLNEVRELNVKAGVLPRTHGSAIFQRGDTQILTTVTLGGPSDVLLLDTMEIEAKKRYIHYYNFPAFSVGEVRPNRGPGRREIGHGALAERALIPVLPPQEKWPYTMLLVSEVLSSNGSSSMASACGSSLSLMDAGVPITKPVAGIAMGLIYESADNYKIITDIAGVEDEKGDMDLKVAGTADGITALQMDIKVDGLPAEVLLAALQQAREARLHILEAMSQVIAEPRADLSPYAPRIEILKVPVERIKDLIGPKGKNINEIIEKTGVDIDIDDDGLVSITSNDAEAMAEAKKWVSNFSRELKVGERFEGKVTRLMEFGAFVELMPGVEGMVHISQFRDERVNNIRDVVKVGDVIPVVIIEIDNMGRINLSHKVALTGEMPDANNSRSNYRPRNNNRSRSNYNNHSRRGPERR